MADLIGAFFTMCKWRSWSRLHLFLLLGLAKQIYGWISVAKGGLKHFDPISSFCFSYDALSCLIIKTAICLLFYSIKAFYRCFCLGMGRC